MKLTKQQTKKMLQVVVMLCILINLPALHVLAQPEGPGGDPGAPIDGGLSLLVAAGIGYGAKKVHAARKAERSKGGLKPRSR